MGSPLGCAILGRGSPLSEKLPEFERSLGEFRRQIYNHFDNETYCFTVDTTNFAPSLFRGLQELFNFGLLAADVRVNKKSFFLLF